MKKDRNLMDELHMMLEKAMQEEYKKLLCGRPKREKEINKEDVIDLQIALNSSKTIEEFLDRV